MCPQGDGSSHNGTAHVAFGSSNSLGPCDFKDFVAQSHTPNDHCVRFAVVVTFPDATLFTRRALPLTWAGLSRAGSRQLRLAHCYSFTAVDFHHILLASLPAHSLAVRPAHSRSHQIRDRYPGASDFSSPPCLPRLLPAGAIAGWALHPLEKRRLVTAHVETGPSHLLRFVELMTQSGGKSRTEALVR